MTCSALIVMSPSAVLTVQVLASVKWAQPLMTLTFDFFSRAATPAFSLRTMPSFQAVVWARSMAGLLAVMPRVQPAAALLTVSNF